MIVDNIQKEITDAMKAHEAVRLSVLKMLSSALSYEKIAKQHDLGEEEELAVVRSEAKKRKDAIEAYEKAGQTERAEKEKEELSILEKYLPAQMSDEDLTVLVESAIAEVGATQMSDMGRVIGLVMKKAGAKVDGGRVSQAVKSKLA